ncbi:hypothetical protein TSAR_015760 [Trichomalopsis sarcophagae]|uniref:PAS domain-containing protein n=1 Tax=Trichomalopsis sarcophagae TaxID=543379 RepID=A0A232EL18_9HYME|nr:hypothetical protein TSAR_015760 [Trichomalopsis sarcophagae]
MSIPRVAEAEIGIAAGCRSAKYVQSDRCEQIDERCEQTAKGPDKRGDREPTRPPAPAAIHEAETITASAYGTRMRLPQEGELLSARFEKRPGVRKHAHAEHWILKAVMGEEKTRRQAMSGFIMMMTQQGKLLYISENAAEYLGHSMEDLLIHGDSVYDVVDKQDHMVIQSQLGRSSGPGAPDDRRLFLCRINVSRNSRRQLRFGDQKVVLVEGHYLPFVPLCNRNESVFLASCTPVVLPETRESVVQGATNIFTTIHSMDMKYLHIDKTAESHMEYSRSELVGVSWYNLLHWDSIRTAYCKHQTVIQSDQERSSTALLRLQSRSGRWFWVHCVLQVKDTSEECQHPIIVCTNQVLSDKEAEILRASSWLYQYSSQTKFTYGVCASLPNSGPQPPPSVQQHQQHTPPPLVYAPEGPGVIADYNNGRPGLTPYGLPLPPPPHELELGPVGYHQMDDGQIGVPWSKERTLVKQEPGEVYGEANNAVRTSQQRSIHGQESEAAEPVDMSINNSATPGELHDERHPAMHQHCDAGPAEFCPCNKAHLPMMQHNNKSPNRPMSTSLPTYLRPGSKSLSYFMSNQPQSPGQQMHQQMSPGMAPSPDNNGGLKYNIVDLDKLSSHPADQSPQPPPPPDIYGPTYSQKRQLLLLHQTKAPNQQPGEPPHPCVADAAHHHLAHHHPRYIYPPDDRQEQWTSPSGPAASSPSTPGLWPDCGLQRVPDVVHQELSPYITTPTTPADTPDDSSEHQTTPGTTPVSVFNFDWPGEQHVPNLRVLSFRSSNSVAGNYPETRRPTEIVQPITLQLPRKKNIVDSPHRDYAK